LVSISQELWLAESSKFEFFLLSQNYTVVAKSAKSGPV
jgi:hypothetical protein